MENSLLDYELFLGYPIDTDYQNKLDALQPSLKNLFIQDHADYLKIIEYQGTNYLGKSLGRSMDTQSLELLKDNIFSILNRLIPQSAYESEKILLLPIEMKEHD